MDENQTKQSDLLDTTDCLEAVGVFRGWKNFFFVIALLCLIALQVSFCLVDRDYIAPCDKAWGDTCVAACKINSPPVPGQTDAIKEAPAVLLRKDEAAGAVEPNKPAEPACGKHQKTRFPLSINLRHLCWAIRIANGLLILTAVLHCLCMLFSLKISLIGRLGGINHISRAFFLSLITVVLLLLRQISLGHIPGAIYTPCELLKWHNAPTTDIFGNALYYLRFSGYGLLVLLLLIFSQIRSSRWAKAVLRRLEVI